MKRIFILLLMFCSVTTVFSQNITKAEYFFDTDPGPGNGTPITIPSPADSVSFSANVLTTGLGNGFHYLSVRVRDAEGKWSRFDSRNFYILNGNTTNAANITGAEYFIDTDPGPGNGIQVPVGTSGENVTFTAMIPAGLSGGFHWLGMRTKDADGKWGFFERRSFYVNPIPTDMTSVVAAEYFYDNDPGVGNGTSLTINNSGYTVTQTFMIPVPATMSAGGHYLCIRVKDQEGKWSLFKRDSVTVSSTGTISCPNNATVVFDGGCTAAVNNIDPVVTPQGSSYTYTLTGATTGSGNGTASGQVFNSGVTTVTYALTNSPSVSCSFTVTVNASITPTVNLDASGTEICPGQQVVFTTISFHGGATPSYQWKLNGNNIPGATNSTYQSTSLANGDIVSVTMTSSLGCANPQTVPSNTIFINVSSTVFPMVSLGMSATTICTGTPVNFIATPTNGGISPTYQWKLNGNIIPGVTGSTYQSSSLANGDRVSVTMTSSLACANPQTATMTGLPMTVTPTLPPSVYVESETTICAGTTATFFASPSNGGTDPSYQWKVNGNNVGSDTDTYSSSSLNNGDIVTVVMTSSLGCASPQAATSSPITMTVLPSSPASVNINASSTTICPGTSATFTVTSVTAGASYQWQLNGNNIPGATGTTYQSSSLQNGDKIKVNMTQSSPCLPSSSVASNEITIAVIQNVLPMVTIVPVASAICSGTTVTFTASPTNGGPDPSYQWKVNGNNVDGNSVTYETAALNDGDIVSVEMVSSLECASSSPVSSGGLPMTVLPSTPAFVEISASASTICSGTSVTFNVTSAVGSAGYQWQLNGNDIPGATNETYQTSSLVNGDKIKVVMTTLSPCAFPSPAVSNEIAMTVNTADPASVSIVASSTTICSGTQVTFTATPVNGGNPTYEWKVNGVSVATTNSNTYQSSALEDGDFIVVWMTTSLGCVSPLTVPSNTIVMNVSSQLTYYRDLDGDGYGNASSGTTQACGPYPGWVASNTDCNDGNASVHPGAAETCGNNSDDDCDGQVDEGCTSSPDNDGDGYTVAQGDCNDNNVTVHPGATEVCGNNVDDDCDGQADEGCGATNLPVIMLRTYPVKEGDAGQTILNVEVNLDLPAPLPVTIHYSTINDDAIAGSDYVATNGILVIPAGSVSGSIQVRIIGDLLRENNERFRINFTDPVNAALIGDPYSRVMIIDNDKGKNNTNNSAARTDQVPVKEEIFKIPTVTRRNQVWVIPQIGNYENEVLIVNVQGQVVSRFVNYHNQASLGNVSTGLYFYRTKIIEKPGQYKYYSGRLLITE